MDLPTPIVHEIVVDRQYIASKHLAEMTPEELDSDWKLDDFFGCVYIINLPQATQRLEKITQNLHQIGMKTFQVLSAVDGRKELPPEIWQKFWKNWHHYNLNKPRGRKAFDNQRKGEAGCFMSHYRVLEGVKNSFETAIQQLKEARAKGDTERAEQALQTARRFSSVLILEDDNGFGILDENKKASLEGCGVLLRQIMQELPKTWDILYFAFRSSESSTPFSQHLRRIKHTYGTNAYAVNYPMYKDLYMHLSRIVNPTVYRLTPLDREISLCFTGHKIFAILPSLAYQSAGRSYITTDPKRLPSQ